MYVVLNSATTAVSCFAVDDAGNIKHAIDIGNPQNPATMVGGAGYSAVRGMLPGKPQYKELSVLKSDAISAANRGVIDPRPSQFEKPKTRATPKNVSPPVVKPSQYVRDILHELAAQEAKAQEAKAAIHKALDGLVKVDVNGVVYNLQIAGTLTSRALAVLVTSCWGAESTYIDPEWYKIGADSACYIAIDTSNADNVIWFSLDSNAMRYMMVPRTGRVYTRGAADAAAGPDGPVLRSPSVVNESPMLPPMLQPTTLRVVGGSRTNTRTVKTLRALAAKRGVPGRSAMNKAQLVLALKGLERIARAQFI